MPLIDHDDVIDALATDRADQGLCALTAKVMAFGQFLAGYWLAIVLVLLALIAMVVVAAGAAAQNRIELPQWLRHLSRNVLRRMAVARLALQLAEMLRSGVPMVKALRVLAPTATGHLGRRLLDAALLSSKVGVSRPYDSGRGFRERQDDDFEPILV